MQPCTGERDRSRGLVSALAPASRARMFVVPLIALSATLVVLVIAIVIVVTTRDDDRPTGTATAGQVDRCVVGHWRVTSHREEVDPDVPGIGKVTFTGSGAEIRLKDDGTGATDYGAATRFEGTVSGQTIGLAIGGTVTYRFATVDGSFSFRDMHSNATSRAFVDGREYGTEQVFQSDDSDASYECSQDALVEHTDWYESRMTRID